MLRNDYEGQSCPIAGSLELIGERWTLLVVRDILLGHRRFGELQEELGIARNVLTNRLARLCDEGILERRQYQDNPPRCEYFLTEKGLDLWPVLMALRGWGERNAGYEPNVDVLHKGCGGRITDRGHCSRCDEELSARDAGTVARAAAPALSGA